MGFFKECGVFPVVHTTFPVHEQLVADAGADVVLGLAANTAAITAARTLGPVGSIVAGAAVVAGKILYEVGKDRGYEDGHREGRESGFGDGYKKGCIDTAKKSNETVEQHINRVASFYGLAVCIGNLDGTFDEEDQQAVIKVLGDPNLQEEYVKNELKKIFQTQPNFETIKKRYLDKLSLEDVKKLDEIIRDFMYVDDVVHDNEINFYDHQWQPYLNRRTN